MDRPQDGSQDFEPLADMERQSEATAEQVADLREGTERLFHLREGTESPESKRVDDSATGRFIALHETRLLEAVDAAERVADALVDRLGPELTDEGREELLGFRSDLRVNFATIAEQLRIFTSEVDAVLRSSSAVMVSVSLETVRRDVDDLRARLDELGAASASTSQGGHAVPMETSGFDRLGRLLEKALGHWWRLVAGLLTPKEWTLKGELKIPFLANAGVEIKFGRDDTQALSIRT